MNESKITVRYAKALFSTAKESGVLEHLEDDFKLLYQCIREIPELKYVIQSPIIKTSVKVKLFREMFGKSFNPLSLSFNDLVLNQRREEYLEGISRYFLAMIKTQQGIQPAELVTAVALDDSLRQSILKLITKKFSITKVEMSESVDQKLIGGFILRIGDQQLDASISTKLKRIQKDLSGSYA